MKITKNPKPQKTLKLGCLYLSSLVFLILSIATASTPLRDVRTHSSVLTASTNPQVLHGADIYYERCAVCHGDTAKGFDEARTVFPEEHQKCERCHRKNNPPQMDMQQMSWRSAFSIGEAPALHGEFALPNFRNGFVLYSYISASMPRPFPGLLEEDEYWAITAFLLDVNGADLGEISLDQTNAASFNLSD